MKRLLNQISAKSKVDQYKSLFLMVNKMLDSKTTYENSNDLRVHTPLETPEQTTMQILNCIAEFELRDQKINQKLKRDDNIENALKM